jgi:serine/threonine protein kinase/WD40 repeat protein/tetratricopeptide (TPR) repeat protein
MNDNSPSAADPFGQIADEFLEALRQGQSPSVEEFARRYPEQAEQIRDMLPALVLMEQAKATEDSAGQQNQPKARTAATPLKQLGDYQILREVGRGGMGVVYEAQQLSLGRHVAIKVLPAHALLDARHLARFHREARSAARLHHTNIVPVFGVGEQDGLHYYVMQFIPGLGLDTVLHELRRLRLPRGKQAPTQGDVPGRPTNITRDRSAVDVARALLSGEFRRPERSGVLTAAPDEPAEERDEGRGMRDEGRQQDASGSSLIPRPSLSSSATIHLPGQSGGSSLSESSNQYWQSVARVGLQVADALAHAASQGVLHRDIKPSNLLLDDTGNVWVTDFGLAKASSDSDELTHTGDIIGTMRYMAPERFNGQGDLRSDVYSLGLTLYELLALRPAFDEADRNKLVKQVMHDEPVRPRKLNPGVPRDLETVVLKAIARDPAHRYQTPTEMAEDLKRFVEDRPVKARRVSETEKFWRWCRRNPLPAGLLAGIVLVFLAGFAGVSWQWRKAMTARENERYQRGQAETARDEARQARNTAARQAAGLLLDRGIEDARGGEPARALHLFVRALQALPPDDPEAAPLERTIRANLSAWAETVPALEHIWPSGPWRSNDVAFSPDGQRIAIAVGKNEVQCFRTDTGQPVGPPLKIAFHINAAIEFAADGQSLWIASPGPKNLADPWSVYRLDPESGRPIQPPIPSTGPVIRFAVTPDGRYLVGAIWGLHPEDRGPGGDADGVRKWRTASIVVWEAATGRVVRKLDVNVVTDFATADRCPDSYMNLSPDGKTVTAWVPRGSDRFVGMSFTVDGNEPPIQVALPPVGTKAPWTLHFQNHMRTALAIKDGRLHRWNATNPGVLGPGVPSPFRGMHYGPSADGRSIVSTTEGRVFDTGTWPPRPSGARFAHPGWERGFGGNMEQSPDGRFTATWHWGHEGGGRLWRLPRSHSRPTLPFSEFARQSERTDYIHAAQFNPRGTSAILWSYRQAHWVPAPEDIHSIRLVNGATGAAGVTSVRHAELVREVAFTPDGRYFATASYDGTARVWETATGRSAGPPLAHTNHVATVAFSPDGNTLAAGDYGPAGLIKLWEWRTGKEVRPPLRHDDIVMNVTFSPDGRYLAAIKLSVWSKNPELLVWEVTSGTVVTRMRYSCPSYLLRETVRFRPDSRAVTARDFSGVLRLWEVHSGALLGERPLDGDGVTRFSPDGRMVAAAANLGVRLLDGNTLAPLPVGYFPHPDPILDVAFSPDGTFLLTAHENGSAQLWDVATRKPVGPPAVLFGPIRAVAFTPDGKTCLCVATDGTVRRWPVPAPFAEPDLARLADRVTLMTGQRMDDSQGLDVIPANDWRTLRAKLVGDGSTALVPPRPDADWHDAVAADAEQDGDAIGAEWHLNRLAALRPRDWTIPARRGRVLAAAGRQDEAAAAYDLAVRLAPSPRDLADWLRAAATDDEAAMRYDRGLWNLDRAVQLTPDDWVPYAARAALLDRAGHAARAAADIDAAVRLGADATVIVQSVERAVPRAKKHADWTRLATFLTTAAKDATLPIDDRYHLAVACLKAGDRDAYKAACAGIAGRMPPAGTPLYLGDAVAATKAFALGPGATDDWSVPLSWADRVLTRYAEREAADPSSKERDKPWRHLFLHVRGALLYRAGRPEAAAAALRDPSSHHPLDSEFSNWAYLALAEHAVGRADKAQEAAARARATRPARKDNEAWDRAEVELLTAELNAALPPPVGEKGEKVSRP